MDSLDWSRKYEVLSISRLALSLLGFSTEQINSLTDDDMQFIAETLHEQLDEAIHGFTEQVEFVTDLLLTQKKEHPNGEEPLRQDGDGGN